MISSSTVTVYNFKIFREASVGWVQSPYKASKQTIEQLGGLLLLGTNEDIDADLLDEEGLYRRVPIGWGLLNRSSSR